MYESASLAVSPAEVIDDAPFFAMLSPAQRAGVARLAKTLEFASGRDLYRVGEKADCCYILAHGAVRFNLALGERTASAGHAIRRGELFGWAALIRDVQTRIATATCLSSCAVVAIPGDALLDHMDADHSLGYAIMTRLTLLLAGTITALVTG